MRIGIITFHFAHNHGAVLQCCALQKYLESQGHDVKVINYRPKYHTVRYDAVKNPFRYASDVCKKKKCTSVGRIKVFCRSIARCMKLNIKGTDKKNAAFFGEFTSKNLHLTKRYTSLKSLKKNPPEFEAYISGSDQLWNPDLLDQKFDRAYFLDFGKPECRRIAYAVSMGKEFSPEECRHLKELCAPLDAVSLREKTPSVIDAIERDVHICIDPTLLIDAEYYHGLESKEKEKEPYIFVYGFETSDAIKKAIDMASKKFGCRIINGSPGRVKLTGENVENIRDYAPDRFLSFIKNAEYVVTNSFHATVFSVIYKKRFATVPHTTRGRRMVELLGKLGLNDALWGTPGFSMDYLPDYDSAYEKLEALRNNSKNYINKTLSGCKGEEIEHMDVEDSSCYARIKPSERYSDLNATYGYYKNTDKLKKSASGGVASAMSEAVIKEGGAVYGVVYRDDFKSACYQRADSLEQIERFKGSKYFVPELVMPNGESVFSDIEKTLNEGKTVLFIGLGCMVGALKKYAESHKLDETKLYTVDLICHGPMLASAQADFVARLETKYKSKLVDFTMRYKKTGWTPNYIRAEFANGKCYEEPFYETELGYAFKTYSRKSCFSCKFKGHDHVADVTVGDYWGLKSGMHGYNKNGVSIMLSKTEKGNELLAKIDSSAFLIEKADIDTAIVNNPMFEESRVNPAYYDAFDKDFKEHGLHYACIRSPEFKAYKKLASRKKIKRLFKL